MSMFSCLARQAKILVAEAEERNLDDDKWARWHTCSLCEQQYHGVVKCALGWACWKTYLGRPETDRFRISAMGLLGSGLSAAKRHLDALSVKEAKLATLRRLGGSEQNILTAQGNLANAYEHLGRLEQAVPMRQEIYSGRLKLSGEEHEETLRAANNYASSLNQLRRFEETKVLLRKTMPVARRALGEGNEMTLRMRWNYAEALYRDDGATLDDLREAVSTLEETVRTARRVLGSEHPFTVGMGESLRRARAALSARVGPGGA